MIIQVDPNNSRRLLVYGADNTIIMGKKFRNFEGNERRNPNTGTIINSKGNRNFNLRITDEYLDLFRSLNCRIKEYGGNPEEGEAPLRYVKVNVNVDSQIPPDLRIIKSNNTIEPTGMPVDQYKNLDKMFIVYADLTIGMSTSANDGMTSLWLNVGRFKQYTDPITEKWDVKMEEEGVEPNINDEI
jgi:hypothetical protein